MIDWFWIIFSLIGLLVIILAFYLNYKKETLLIKKGVNYNIIEKKRQEDKLSAGLISAGIGLALFIGLILGIGKNTLMIPALILFFLGLALIISYIISK